MVSVEIKYVKVQRRRRARRDGTVWGRDYYYYRRPGAPDDGARLPDDPRSPEFAARLREFNARAEAVPVVAEPKSFAALVDKFLMAPEFTDLSDKSRKDYGRILKGLRERFGPLPYAAVDREVVYALRDSMAATPRAANYTLAVLRRLFGWAMDRNMLASNPAARPRQLKTKPRHTVWSLDAEADFLAVASAPMRLAYMLAAYTAQRQGDILRMTWAQYDGDVIRLRQRKTGRLVDVPCHEDLQAALASAPRVAVQILTTEAGQPFKEDHFRHEWRKATLAAGLDGLQFRDLRRTAMVRMAEAEANDIEISAVSGHDIETTRQILETYIPRTASMARAAVSKLEAKGRKRNSSGKQGPEKVGNNDRGA